MNRKALGARGSMMDELFGGPPKRARGPRAFPAEAEVRMLSAWREPYGFGQDAQNHRLEAGSTRERRCRWIRSRRESARSASRRKSTNSAMNLKLSSLIKVNRTRGKARGCRLGGSPTVLGRMPKTTGWKPVPPVRGAAGRSGLSGSARNASRKKSPNSAMNLKRSSLIKVNRTRGKARGCRLGGGLTVLGRMPKTTGWKPVPPKRSAAAGRDGRPSPNLSHELKKCTGG